MANYSAANPYGSMLPDDMRKAAAWQGLQALASSLLASSAPSPVPNPFGASLGRAMNAFQTAQNATQANALQTTLASGQLKLQDAQRKKLEADVAAGEEWRQGLQPPQGGAPAAAPSPLQPG